MAAKAQSFEDLLPVMAEKLGGEGLIVELCNGFRLLMDESKGLITFDSLKKNSALLGLQDLGDDDLRSMIREGDYDGDEALNQMEFCVLMFRLSPDLMDQAKLLLEEDVGGSRSLEDVAYAPPSQPRFRQNDIADNGLQGDLLRSSFGVEHSSRHNKRKRRGDR